ncbi:MAG: hypothetical protein HQ504_12125 [Rhodospirillaceae bacterium]|nr:hypothetical protein [Rhodospirillaceae bacterium]
MTSNSEIWRCASLLVEKYGDMALNGAAIKADELARAGDNEGRFVWLEVTRAVEELLSQTPPENATLH